jgi:calcium/calmodulin-dependent protein kinase (CaM kinase) II
MDTDRGCQAAAELLALTRQLLRAIDEQDWATYEKLCDPTLTSREPEADSHLVEGLDFHRFYFELHASGKKVSTVSSPHVRVMGDVAVVTYVRLVQQTGPDGEAHSRAVGETRVWQKQDGRWRHVHFHRS